MQELGLACLGLGSALSWGVVFAGSALHEKTIYAHIKSNIMQCAPRRRCSIGARSQADARRHGKRRRTLTLGADHRRLRPPRLGAGWAQARSRAPAGRPARRWTRDDAFGARWGPIGLRRRRRLRRRDAFGASCSRRQRRCRRRPPRRRSCRLRLPLAGIGPRGAGGARAVRVALTARHSAPRSGALGSGRSRAAPGAAVEAPRRPARGRGAARGGASGRPRRRVGRPAAGRRRGPGPAGPAGAGRPGASGGAPSAARARRALHAWPGPEPRPKGPPGANAGPGRARLDPGGGRARTRPGAPRRRRPQRPGAARGCRASASGRVAGGRRRRSARRRGFAAPARRLPRGRWR